jgi:hypothetical protein
MNHKFDDLHTALEPIVAKKIEILKTIIQDKNDFYFEFEFDHIKNMGFCYDNGWNKTGRFEICYYDMRDCLHQIRTYFI